MTKFLKIDTLYPGTIDEMIVNVDDIGHISVGPNLIFLKTHFADGSNRISVSSETIEKLKRVLKVEELGDE